MQLHLAALFLAAALVVSACTGGGGGGGIASGLAGRSLGGPGPSRPATVVPAPRAVPAALRIAAAGYTGHSEYSRNWGLRQIGAAEAYARIAQRDGAGTAPGDGARVAVIDNGIDLGHWEFDTSRITRTNQPVSAVPTHGTAVASVIAAKRETRSFNPPSLAQLNFHGVAWGVQKLQIMSVALGSADPNANYVGLAASKVGGHVNWLASLVSGLAESDFVNMSFGAHGLVENYRNMNFGAQYTSAVQSLAGASAGAAGKAILVVAAGNAHGDKCASPEPNCVGGRIRATSPELDAGLPVLEASLRSHMVAVVATDSSGRIAAFSNRCGIAAKWCIAAPGARVPAAYYGPHPNDPGRNARGYYNPSGTSFAAPYVTGGLAVLKHWFRSQLKNEELLERLYRTARVTPDPVSAHGGTCPDWLDTDGDRSRCELSSVFGRGVMDLGRATAPAGTTSIARGNTVGGPGARVGLTAFSSGGAFGNALTLSFAGREIAAFDELGAPFWFGLGGFARAAPRASAFDRLDAFLAPEAWAPRDDPAGPGTIRAAGTARTAAAAPPPLLGGFAPMDRGAGWPVGREGLRFGFVDAPAPAPGGGHLSLARRALAFEAAGPGGLGFAAFSTEGMNGRSPVSGAMLSWSPAAPNEPGDRPGARAGAPLKLTAGWIGERETMLGSRPAGAFGRLAAGSAFVGFDGGARLGAWRLNASVEAGMAYARAGGGMVTGVSPLASSAFALRAERPLDAAGSLRLSVSQPLRVESGRARLSIPVGRTTAGRVLRRPLSANLAPSGRQIDISARWRKRLANGGDLRLGAVWTLQPGHDAAAPAELTAMAGYRHSF